MVDVLKNLMSTMTDTILQQVTEQAKKAMEATNCARPIPTFDYVPTMGCEPSHRHAPIRSHCRSDEVREMACPEKDGRSLDGNHDWSVKSKLQSLEGKSREGDTLLSAARPRPPPMTTTPKPHNTPKYCEFHEQNGRTTTECRELRKALHQLVDKGQIDRFLKRGPQFLHKEHQPTCLEPREEECSTE
ncbi:hypothetical protein Cgig2_005766 [Carnegiea gigantea]|uniref:Reverse transcriptase domain-containing protein n=1 Tax=Carnegiea gigantea TaxID=171969 RepID=A0A9Q1GVG6_9CARY|nr:hypothetical protein Cgig2_005766 [Carnegiea gigantea]